MRGVLAPVRGGRHRRGRRLRPDGRPARGHAAAPRTRPRQRPGQPAQRPPGRIADRQHRRRPRHLPPAVRRAARLRHRDARAQRLGLDADVAARPRTSRATRPTRWPRRRRPPGHGRHADPPGRRVVVGRRAGPARRSPPRSAERGPGRRRCDAVAEGPARPGEPVRAARRRGGAARTAGWCAASRVGDGDRREARWARRSRRRLERGAGLPALDRLGYLAEFATAQLAGLRHLSSSTPRRRCRSSPTPDKPSYLVPEGCEVHALAGAGRTTRPAALDALADAVVRRRPTAPLPSRPPGPTARPAPLTGETVAAAVGALLPEGAIVADEAQHGGLLRSPAPPPARPAHDWLTLTGGAIGLGLPARHRRRGRGPDRPVWPRRPTAARCTRCRRCGPRPARAST